MTFQVSMLMHADGDQAAAEVRKVGAAAKETSAAAEQLDAKGRKAAGGVKTMGSAAGVADAKLDQLSAAERRAAQSAVALGASHRSAAASTGNLVAQFNDVGMMLAAGQNPLQLALQQGTQITQVIGPMGATGAVRALGGAFLSMLSPINLVTIGGIAAGAAITQWLFKAGEEAETLEDKLDRLDEAMSALQSAQKNADTPYRKLLDDYGSLAKEARAIFDINREIAAIQAQDALDTASRGIAGELGIEEVFGFGPEEIRDFEATIASLQQRLVDLNSKPSFEMSDEEFAAANRQIGEIKGKLDNLKGVSKNVDELADAFGITEDAAKDVVAQFAAIGQAQGPRDQARAIIDLADFVIGVSNNLADAEDEGKALYDQLRAAAIQALELAKVDLSSNIGAGADEAARLADNLERARGARIDQLTGGNPDFSDPRNEAGLSGRILRDRPVPKENRPGYTPPRRRGAGARAERDAVADLIQELEREIALMQETDPVQQALIENREVLAEATDAERRVIEQLIIAREQEKVAAAAAAEQRQFFLETSYDAIELLAARGGDLSDMWDMVAASIARAALQASLLGTGPLAGLFGTAGGGGLLEIAASALGLAEGGEVPGDQVVAVSSGEFRVPREVARKHMPLLDAINAHREAAVGLITGPGGGTSDDVLMRAQSGDYIVNAAATARNRPLLEAMVGGSPLQALAAGGPVGGTALVPPPPVPVAGQSATRDRAETTSRGQMDIRILPSREFDAVIESKSQDVATEVVRQYDRYVAPDTARAAVRDHRRDG